MFQHLKERSANEPILFMDGGDRLVQDGDWVYLESLTDEAICVTVERTDRDAPNDCYQGRIRYFESELDQGSESLACLGLECGQMIQFQEKHIFSCTHQGIPMAQRRGMRQRMDTRRPQHPPAL